MNIVIIGGGSAGTTSAFELRKHDKNSDITIIESSSNLQYSPCALPYVIEGEIKDFNEIFLFRKKTYSDNNIKVLLNSFCTEIDRKKKKIYFKVKGKKDFDSIKYDKLIIATGSSSFISAIDGLEKVKYHTFKNIEDAKKIVKISKTKSSLAILGAGMIGVELAYALSKLKNKVNIIEIKENILPNMLDKDMAEILKEYLSTKKIKIFENQNVREINKKQIYLENNIVKYDELFICTGVRPNLEFAKKSGLKIKDGLVLDKYLKTSDENIYACGDCCESKELGTNLSILSQLGTTAVNQAKLVAKNIVGLNVERELVMNNTISKIGELYVASVGLTKKRAEENNIKTLSAKYSGTLRAHYYSTKEKIFVKIVSDVDGKIIGSQIIGNNDVVGRINVMALAIKKQMTVQELSELETCYNPASSPIFDPITIACEILLKKISFTKRKLNK